MASIYDYFGEKQNLWQDQAYSTQIDLSVTEIWQGQGNSPHLTSDRVAKPHEIISEAREPRYRVDHGAQRQCALRVVWIVQDRKRQLHCVEEHAFQQLVTAFGHQLAQGYAEAQFAGIGSLPKGPDSCESFFLCNEPKLAVTWSQNDTASTTNVICKAEESQIKIIRDLLGCPFIQRLAHLKMLPPMICAIMHSKEVDLSLQQVRTNVQEVEVRTGHHIWKVPRENASLDSLFNLSAKMSGSASKLAAIARKLEVLDNLNRFPLERLSGYSNGGIDVDGNEELVANVLTLERRGAMQKIHLEYIQRRTLIQRDALFNLISSGDAIANQKLAKDAHELAQAGQSDARSMKSLAIVTMFFLPGTFVSSLLSMPLFDWQSDSSEGSLESGAWGSRLELYMMVTAPLMVLTFTLWGVLTIWDQRKREKRRIMEQQHMVQGLAVPEFQALALKRLSTDVG